MFILPRADGVSLCYCFLIRFFLNKSFSVDCPCIKNLNIKKIAKLYLPLFLQKFAKDFSALLKKR
ncbi:hypothetical protein HM1_0842 [Heliomicrobium modesticaldum Ice1]|uniref:Uncharacterized protein n=1 Tax=Heliobacterium modesticaldum (strain ATCC 51547 / Ice1) TaxID=498761 RepID=B0TAR6_HELMI|nr:hypothetical protein HM1_0842 [Heliomicrobium modesticaldum Ice1]